MLFIKGRKSSSLRRTSDVLIREDVAFHRPKERVCNDLSLGDTARAVGLATSEVLYTGE